MAGRVKSQARKLSSWTESLNVGVPNLVEDPADPVGSALSPVDPAGWRPALADGDSGNLLSQGGKSPISLLSADSPAQESSSCRRNSQGELRREPTNSSAPLYCSTEFEQAVHAADSAPKRRAASEDVHENSPRTQQDTLNPPDNTTADDPRNDPLEPPYVNPGREGEEVTSSAQRHGENPGEVTNDDLGPALSIEDEQVITRPHFHKASGEEGDGGDGGDERDEGDEGDEKGEEVQ